MFNIHLNCDDVMQIMLFFFYLLHHPGKYIYILLLFLYCLDNYLLQLNLFASIEKNKKICKKEIKLRWTVNTTKKCFQQQSKVYIIFVYVILPFFCLLVTVYYNIYLFLKWIVTSKTFTYAILI